MIVSHDSPLLTKYLGQPARRCPRCGSVRFSVNLMGGLVCSVCSPGEAQFRLVAIENERGRLLWQDADSQPCEATDRGAGGWGAGPAGESGAAVDPFAGMGGSTSAAVDEWSVGVAKPFSDGCSFRVDPPAETRLASLLVSTSLDWCTCQPGGFWDRDVIVDRLAGEYEQIGVRTKFRRPPSTGSWRPLSQAYFAWLVSRVDAWNRQTGRDAGQKELIEVADAAISHRIFGEWAADERLWPRIAPYGYIGPVAYTPWDVEKNAIPWDEAFEDRMAKSREVLGAFSN